MAHTFEELKHMTVAQMRDLAATLEHEALTGYTQLKKQQLLEVLCTALGVEAHAHHEVVGLDKTVVKTQIRALKAKRAEALQSTDRSEFKKILRQIHGLKRKLRRATV